MKETIVVLIAIFLCASCATVEPSYDTATGGGFYYTIRNDETLWRIARTYGVDIETLVAANRIRDPRDIKVGQKIFIPKSARTPERATAHFQEGGDLEVDFVWPVQGKTVSFFKTNLDGSVNKGIDIKAPQGAPVVAAATGYVTFVSDNLPGYGKTVIVEHPFGFATVYAYNEEIVVRCGDKVLKGEVIAKVGSTGRARENSLHFEIRKNAKAQNPFYYLP